MTPRAAAVCRRSTQGASLCQLGTTGHRATYGRNAGRSTPPPIPRRSTLLTFTLNGVAQGRLITDIYPQWGGRREAHYWHLPSMEVGGREALCAELSLSSREKGGLSSPRCASYVTHIGRHTVHIRCHTHTGRHIGRHTGCVPPTKST